MPHALQLLLSLWRFTHVPPQFVVPVGQVHVPATHTCEAPHAVAHEPQWAGSVATSTHWSVQNVCPDEHDEAQVREPPQKVPGLHDTPHAPQFASPAFPEHAPAHDVVPVRHGEVSHVASQKPTRLPLRARNCDAVRRKKSQRLRVRSSVMCESVPRFVNVATVVTTPPGTVQRAMVVEFWT